MDPRTNQVLVWFHTGGQANGTNSNRAGETGFQTTRVIPVVLKKRPVRNFDAKASFEVRNIAVDAEFGEDSENRIDMYKTADTCLYQV